MPFKQFLYLREVIICRSINQAAQNLYVSPQALRSAIGSMEDKLGFKIFERSKQGVTLTPEGEEIEQDVYAISDMSEHWNKIREARGRVDGVVQLVASTSVCNTVIPAIMMECRERYPNLRLQQYEARDDKLLAMLAKRRMIGVVGAAPRDEVLGQHAQYAQFATENQYLLEILREDQFYVFINSKSPLAGQAELELSDLSGLTPAMYPKEEKRLVFKEIFRYFSVAQPFALMHQENIFQLVAENTDIACVFPAVAAENDRHIHNGQVCPMTVRDFPMPAVACMLHPTPRELTSGEKAVMDLIRAKMRTI